MDVLWKIAVTMLLAYVLSISIMRASSLVKAAATKVYHAIAGRGVPDPVVVCEIDTTDGTEQGLVLLVGHAAGSTLSTGEVRGQAALMLESADKLTKRVAEMEGADGPLRVLTFEYPSDLSLRTRGVYLERARRVWAETEDGARFVKGGYDALSKYDGQGRWCIQYLVPNGTSDL